VPNPTGSTIPRHYGLDWLRIGAFGLLILFHIGLYFAPGHWIVKSPHPIPWLTWPLAAISPWRLSLLFAISGYATAAMLQRHPSAVEFLADRSKRLLIPLLFGACVIVPPQDWVRLEVSGVDLAYIPYLLTEHFAFHVRAGTFLPAWEHLWFLAYLAAYTGLLTMVVAVCPGWRKRAAPWLEWLDRGHRLLWLPSAAILTASLLFTRLDYPVLAKSMDYFPAFVIGFGYAHFAEVRAAFVRMARSAAAASALSLAVIWAVTATTLGIGWVVELAAGVVMSWAMLPVAFGLAERLLNFDHPWRRQLGAAVFPAYIVHQTIIVVVGWYLAQLGVVGLPAYLILLVAVIAGCWLVWRLAKGNSIAGMVLGMPHRHRDGHGHSDPRAAASAA
jgi:glucan biosynthesis protein C